MLGALSQLTEPSVVGVPPSYHDMKSAATKAPWRCRSVGLLPVAGGTTVHFPSKVPTLILQAWADGVPSKLLGPVLNLAKKQPMGLVRNSSLVMPYLRRVKTGHMQACKLACSMSVGGQCPWRCSRVVASC